MKLKEQEYKFELNIQSQNDITTLCPENDFSRIGEVLGGNNVTESMNAIIKIACMLNKGYEDHRKYDDDSYDVNYLTEDDCRFLTMQEVMELSKEVTECMNHDAQVSIETEEIKSKKK